MTYKAFGFDYTLANVRERLNAVDSVTLMDDNLPLFVTFADLRNLTSGKIVNPDEFEDVFGIGYSMHGVFLEPTTDEVVQEIEKHLPWLEEPDTPWISVDGDPSKTHVDKRPVHTDHFRTYYEAFRQRGDL